MELRKLVVTALLMALTCVATMVIQVPSPMNGYVNLGDCIVLLSGWLLGPVWGFAAGGIGSALADLLSGYAHYIPGTLIIKGLMAVMAALIAGSSAGHTLRRALSAIAAEVWMVAGYFVYACLLLGKGLSAAASVPGNLLQGAVGLAAGLALFMVLEHSGARKALRLEGER